MKYRDIPLMLSLAVFLCLPSSCDLKCTKSWDYLVFSQQWPETECLDAPSEHHKCAVNNNITSWTVHGLWPTQFGKECPNYCNNSDHFQPQEISSIEAQLREYWPNLFTDEQYYTFWQHEWQKHGTCGKSLEALDSQYKYFNMGLMLNRKFNLTLAFEQKNIKPGNSYQLSDVLDAVEHYGSPKVRCSYIQGKEYLAQISLCLSKEFKVLNCSSVGDMGGHKSLYAVEPCSERHIDTVYYPTILHN